MGVAAWMGNAATRVLRQGHIAIAALACGERAAVKVKNARSIKKMIKEVATVEYYH